MSVLSEAGVGAGHLFRVLSHEMAEMAALSERLQVVLLSACVSAGDQRFFHDAQACDLLTQKLINLTDFLDEIAHVAPEGWIVDVRTACANINLSELTDRLSSRTEVEQEEPGSLEMFL